jgi:hypothetical protein
MSDSASLAHDESGVSEFIGVVILVVLTIVITASLGAQVLIEDPDKEEAKDATFACTYFDSRSAMLLEYQSGDTFGARNITVTGPDEASATWIDLLGKQDQENVTIRPGFNTAAQIWDNNAYGERVEPDDTINVTYVNETGAARTLETLNGSQCN